MSDTSSLVYGGDLMLFMSSGATKTPLAFSTSAKLSISLGTKDASNKDSGYFSEKIGGRFDWNMSTDGLLSYTVSGSTNTMDEVYALMLTRTPVNVAFAIRTGTSPSWTIDATKKQFTGTAIITGLDINADNDSATWSIKLDGTSTLTLA